MARRALLAALDKAAEIAIGIVISLAALPLLLLIIGHSLNAGAWLIGRRLDHGDIIHPLGFVPLVCGSAFAGYWAALRWRNRRLGRRLISK